MRNNYKTKASGTNAKGLSEVLRYGDIGLSEVEKVDIIRRLLKLARAGRCGVIYCDRGVLRIGAECRQRISWSSAKKLADTWVEPKPATRDKRAARLPGWKLA